MSESRDEAAPPAKRARLQNAQDSKLNAAPGSNFSPPPSGANVHGKTPSMPAGFVCEFPVRNLEDFYKPCPNYRLPMEIGSFSLDTKGKVQLDRSQLRYYTPPQVATRVMFDLRVGYDKFVPKKGNVPTNKLNPILEWINGNGDCFRPRRQPLSPPNVSSSSSSSTTTTQSSSQAPVALKNGGLDRSMSLEIIPPTTGASAKERYSLYCVCGQKSCQTFASLHYSTHQPRPSYLISLQHLCIFIYRSMYLVLQRFYLDDII